MNEMSQNFNTKKRIWSSSDFEQMGWHDCRIYGFAFNEDTFEFFLDIDYILEWINPHEQNSNFEFLVAPSTLVFENVWNLQLSLETNLNLEIQDIQRANPRSAKNVKHVQGALEYDWLIETNCGVVTFSSIGYKQYLRKPPIPTDSQKIALKIRGGICFDVNVVG